MNIFKEFVGKTVIEIKQYEKCAMLFICSDDTKYMMLHYQDCCEDVSIEDICGDINDLVGSPILIAEESTQDDPHADESATWTFYKFATAKGYVTIRWYGESNGYYCEEAMFTKTDDDDWVMKGFPFTRISELRMAS